MRHQDVTRMSPNVCDVTKCVCVRQFHDVKCDLMHGFVRNKLADRYGDDYISRGSDPIPAHVFGSKSLAPFISPELLKIDSHF